MIFFDFLLRALKAILHSLGDCIVSVRGTHTDTQDAGNWACTCSCKLRERGKRQEYRREHELRMRAQKANKSGHEYQCKRTIHYRLQINFGCRHIGIASDESAHQFRSSIQNRSIV